MNHLIERLRPWAPTMLLVGLFATLAESLAEQDSTSIALIVISLVGAALVLRASRAVTLDEVRSEIKIGVRAMVAPESLLKAPPRYMAEPPPQTIKRMRGREIEEVPIRSSSLRPQTPDPGASTETIPTDEEWRRFKEGR